MLIDGPVQVRTPTGDLDVGLIGEPPVARGVSARAGGLDELHCEALDPAVDGDVIDGDAALGQQLLYVAVGQGRSAGTSGRPGRSPPAGSGSQRTQKRSPTTSSHQSAGRRDRPTQHSPSAAENRAARAMTVIARHAALGLLSSGNDHLDRRGQISDRSVSQSAEASIGEPGHLLTSRRFQLSGSSLRFSLSSAGRKTSIPSARVLHHSCTRASCAAGAEPRPAGGTGGMARLQHVGAFPSEANSYERRPSF